MTIAMSLKRLGPRVRSRLRWHGWLIVAVCMGTGWACSSLLWHGLGIGNMGLRYGATAGVVYAALLICLRTWLGWVATDALAHPADWSEATDDEEDARREQEEAMRRSTDRSSSMLEWGANLLSFDEAAFVVLVPALILLVLGGVGLVTQIPLWTTEAMAALLAELLLPLLLGGAMLRGRARRAPREASWSDVLNNTWWIGLLLVIVGILVGAGLQWADPELETIRGLFSG